jgi:hypothetical protein
MRYFSLGDHSAFSHKLDPQGTFAARALGSVPRLQADAQFVAMSFASLDTRASVVGHRDKADYARRSPRGRRLAHAGEVDAPPRSRHPSSDRSKGRMQ